VRSTPPWRLPELAACSLPGQYRSRRQAPRLLSLPKSSLCPFLMGDGREGRGDGRTCAASCYLCRLLSPIIVVCDGGIIYRMSRQAQDLWREGTEAACLSSCQSPRSAVWCAWTTPDFCAEIVYTLRHCCPAWRRSGERHGVRECARRGGHAFYRAVASTGCSSA